MEIIATLAILGLCYAVYIQYKLNAKLNDELHDIRTEIVTIETKNNQLKETQNLLVTVNDELKRELDKEVGKNSEILSQKKSSETKMGMISENILPILSQFPYDSQNLRHLGSPIDYIYFDFENAEIIFLEVKSGNAQESKRQKIIKNAVTLGKVFYEEVRINQNGLKIKRAVTKP